MTTSAERRAVVGHIATRIVNLSSVHVDGTDHVDCGVGVDGRGRVDCGVRIDDWGQADCGVCIGCGVRVDSRVRVDGGVRVGGGLRVGVDGVDGAGKTVFADELASAIRALGCPVVRVSLDDFHHVRVIRYRQGRDSPEGFWRDSYDYERFRRDVLDPFAPGGSRRYRPAAHDLETDAVLDMAPVVAAPGSVLVVDGLFLHRDELAGAWDLSVFLDVPFEETARRMADRDGTSPDPEHPGMRRYVHGQRLYFAACAPQQRATILIDNSDLAAPRIIRGC